ncbi:DinB family protein [Lysobacter gummosus]|uniref:DinB family protein n=1 Tax=Lysobacter gummosus TaxID=262324 RepID=UPI00363913C5
MPGSTACSDADSARRVAGMRPDPPHPGPRMREWGRRGPLNSGVPSAGAAAMNLREHAVLMAAYNRWMNDKVYAAAAQLPHEAIAADRGAFFGSILGTLNHLLVADQVWLHRFAAHPRASLRSIRSARGRGRSISPRSSTTACRRCAPSARPWTP